MSITYFNGEQTVTSLIWSISSISNLSPLPPSPPKLWHVIWTCSTKLFISFVQNTSFCLGLKNSCKYANLQMIISLPLQLHYSLPRHEAGVKRTVCPNYMYCVRFFPILGKCELTSSVYSVGSILQLSFLDDLRECDGFWLHLPRLVEMILFDRFNFQQIDVHKYQSKAHYLISSTF